MAEPIAADHDGPGQPESFERDDGWGTAFEIGTIIAVACGGFLVFSHLVGFTTVTVRGATRSGKLKWQERQAEIEQVIQTSTLPSAPSAPSRLDQK